MHIKKTLAALGFLALAAAAPSAGAETRDGLGVWEGTGTAHAVGGADLGGFTVSVTRRAEGATKVRADGKVTLTNGHIITFWQEIDQGSQGGFRIVSSNGVGGGRCFANGMCQSYEQRKDGHAFATTIVKDAPDKLRVLVTELDKGHAVRFMEQTLTKKR